MIYGIDLGTTNSLIGSGEDLYTGLVSSNVNLDKKVCVARDSYEENTIASYKTDMGLGLEGATSVSCSSVVLKHLAKVAAKRSGETVKDVVITVPAYFSASQREAVIRAASQADLNVIRLLNEPTAASFYVCRDRKELVVVFDLGGGTFDVTIVDSRTGMYSVQATSGSILGGDDLDQYLVNLIIETSKVKVRYRTASSKRKLLVLVRQAKESIQKTGDDVYIPMSDFKCDSDFLLTDDIYKNAVETVFSRALEMTQYLIAKNIGTVDVPKIVFVGGSTFCPYLRDFILSNTQLEEIRSNTNPDLIVAKGAAFYAGWLDKGSVDSIVEDVTKRLSIQDSDGNTLTIIDDNSIIPCEGSIIVCNRKTSNKLRLPLYQGDSLLAQNNTYIGTLVYDYGREVEAGEGTVEVFASVTYNGIIELSAVETLYYGAVPTSMTLTAR